jgi:hypothetical protein
MIMEKRKGIMNELMNARKIQGALRTTGSETEIKSLQHFVKSRFTFIAP